jgi:hypothetical protein
MVLRLATFDDTALSSLGESDFQTPRGSIGPQKSGRVSRDGAFTSPSADGAG